MNPALAPLGPEGFRDAVDVSRETLERLGRHAALLEKWSRAINLVGRRTLADLWRRHMLDSAQLLDYLPPAPRGRPRVLVDLGSGAGFPGLVLAILGAGQVHLIEANRKKAAFLREAARASSAEATVHGVRIEDLGTLRADVVTARAVAPLPRLLDLAAPFLCREDHGGDDEANIQAKGPAGLGPVALFLAGAGVERQLTESRETWMMHTEVFPSCSDTRGRIVRLSGLARKEQ